MSTEVEYRRKPDPDHSVTAAGGLHICPPSGVVPDVCPLRYGSATEQLSLISFLFLYQSSCLSRWMLGRSVCLEVAIVVHMSLWNCENAHLSQSNIQRAWGCKQIGFLVSPCCTAHDPDCISCPTTSSLIWSKKSNWSFIKFHHSSSVLLKLWFIFPVFSCTLLTVLYSI